jgi:hypothetical protein
MMLEEGPKAFSEGALVVALTIALGGAAAAQGANQSAKYPSWKGQWAPVGQHGTFDPTKPPGAAQQAPLTAEYQKVLAESVANQAAGGPGNDATAECYAGGMPRMMSYEAQEYVITPGVTYILLGGDDNLRRVWTDGRGFPAKINPTYAGYSIGHWIDEGGKGAYDVLEVETRGPFKGPRAYDASGLPLDEDNESTFKERFFIDKSDPNLLHDTITVTDHALTQPWTVDKTFRRVSEARPEWPEYYCHVDSHRLVLGKDSYILGEDGFLRPSIKGQAPPDLRYFKPAAK